MKRNPVCGPAFAWLSVLLPWSVLLADEPALSELLRDALYTEEVARDPGKAAEQYEELLARHDAQKTYAAAALFRLAEVRRKQDRKDDAIQLYQRLIAEFPDAETETRLARENLAALGGNIPEAATAEPDAEAAELARLRALSDTSPDVLLDADTLYQAAHHGWASVVEFLLAKGGRAEDALWVAAGNGNLEIVKLLTEAQADIPDAVAAGAIWAAVDSDRIKVLGYLLGKGLNPGVVDGPHGTLPTFIQAVLGGRLRGAEVLLEHGEDINVMVEARLGPDYFPSGTALHLAIREGNFDAAKWLLEKGAEPDLPDPAYGLSPLHHALGSGYAGYIEMAEALLLAGADPNRRSKDVSLRDSALRAYLMDSTPLEMAVSSRHANVELTKLLLKHGANPNIEGSKISKALARAMNGDMARAMEVAKLLADAGFRMTDHELLRIAGGKNDWNMIELLLKHGANPEHYFGPKGSLLAQACADGNADRIALLLEAGVDVNEVIDGKNALQIISEGWDAEAALPAVKLLLDAGAKPDEEWKRRGFRSAPAQIRELLLETFAIPKLGNESEITLWIDNTNPQYALTIASRAHDPVIPDLAPWILENRSRFSSIPLEEGVELAWTIWRKDETGTWAKREFDVKSSVALPELRWGDVVMCSVIMPDSPARSGPQRRVTTQYRLPDAELWHLRRRISFPITVETAGESREILVRGDRLFFDPTRDEVPLGSARDIAEYLRQKLHRANRVAAIIVSRQDWPEIRMGYGSREAGQFQLQAGDRLKLEVAAGAGEDQDNPRSQLVTMEVDGHPFLRTFGMVSDRSLVPGSFPTLIQALAETQVPWSLGWRDFTEDTSADLAKLHAVDAFEDFTLLPHPDLANIRIRRWTDDGAEKVMEVNLAEIIAASNDQTTVEDAKKADVMLQPGDVVVISLLKDRLGEPWKGFTAKEEAFFAKALRGRVRFTDMEGNMTVRDLRYQTPRFLETDIGWIPLPPESGMPGFRGSWFTEERLINVIRDHAGSRGQNASELFIRDGDAVQVAGTRRQRAVPPPVQSR